MAKANLLPRYDAVLLFDVRDGNPNGDPDANNHPRIDQETGHGLVSDVCLKRKIRNELALRFADLPNQRIYVKDKSILGDAQKEAYTALAIEPGKADGPATARARAWMCQNFVDVRTFGAVMSTTDYRCGQVRGAIQLTFARSVDPIAVKRHCVTRCSITNEKDALASGDNQTFGAKHIVSYGLYVGHLFVNPMLAAQVGFTADDLSRFWLAAANMFESERSAARGLMSVRRLIAFRHENPLGNARASDLFSRVSIQKNPGVVFPRSYGDYAVNVQDKDLPDGVTIEELA